MFKKIKFDVIMSSIFIFIGLALLLLSYYLVFLFNMINIINLIPFISGLIMILIGAWVLRIKD